MKKKIHETTKNKMNKRHKKSENESSSFGSHYKIYYKFLMIIPLIIFIAAISVVFIVQSNEGVPIYRDVSLKGGVSAIINIDSSMSITQLQYELENQFPQNSFSISELYVKGVKNGFVIDTDLSDSNLKSSLNLIFGTKFVDGANYNSNVISSSLSTAFFSQAIKILVVSFLLMSFIIFMYFKEFVPSFAVVLSGFFDIIVTIGVLDLLKVKMSIAGVGSLLMLIGYSIDTDILLTNRLIKEKGDNYFEKVFDAFKTGLLMSITTLIAGLIALFVTNSEVIFQISLILVVGLIVDMISTWIQNTGILLWWLEKKNS